MVKNPPNHAVKPAEARVSALVTVVSSRVRASAAYRMSVRCSERVIEIEYIVAAFAAIYLVGRLALRYPNHPVSRVLLSPFGRESDFASPARPERRRSARIHLGDTGGSASRIALVPLGPDGERLVAYLERRTPWDS
jgi:hypothetical protein